VSDLVAQMTEGRRIEIVGKAYTILAKTLYVSQDGPAEPYYKVFLDGHNVLCVAPAEGFASLGRDVGKIGGDPPFPDVLEYEGRPYTLLKHDYQIVRHLEFGDPLMTEGEVEFWDYEGAEDSTYLLSIGIVKRTLQRADIVARVLDWPAGARLLDSAAGPR
jgi:hypothetical protein